MIKVKVLDYVKSLLSMNLKLFPLLFASIVAIPLMLVFVNGYSQRMQDPGRISVVKNSLYISDELGEYENKLVNTINNSDFKDYIELVKEPDKADYVLNIDREFYDSVTSDRLKPLSLIKNSRESSFKTGLIISNIIESILKPEIQLKNIETTASANQMNMENIKADILTAIDDKVEFSKSTVETVVIQDSYKRAALNSLSFLIIIWLANASIASGHDKLKGYYKRMATMPVNISQRYIVDFFVDSLTIAVLIIVYIFIINILGYGFGNNIAGILLAVIAVSLLSTGIGSLMNVILPKSVSNFFIAILVMLVVFMSSMANIYSSADNKNALIEILFKINASERIHNIFIVAGQNNIRASFFTEVLIYIVFSVILVIIGSIVVSHRKEVRI